MSGHVPDFISKNNYILRDGVEALVTDYSFTSSDEPYIPNTDKLLIRFNDAVQPFDYRTMRPLAATDVPDWLFKGAVVAFGRHGVSKVKEFWGERSKNEEVIRTLISLEGYTPMLLSELRPASEKQVKQYNLQKQNDDLRERLDKAGLFHAWLK